MTTFVFFKLRLKTHCLQYFSKKSSFSYNPFLVRENIAKSSAKSKELICLLNNSRNSPSLDCALCFSNSLVVHL